jgi:hypothetical protein
MFKKAIYYFLFAALPLTAHAGQGTIRETDDVIIIEYSGEGDADVKAAKITKEREEKQAEVDAERQKTRAELSNEKSAAKSAAKIAEKAARKARGEVEEE